MLAMVSIFHGESRNSAELKNSLERIAKAGFKYIHWHNEWNTLYLYSFYEMIQIQQWCRETGLTVYGIHACTPPKNVDLKDYVSINENNRLAGVELVKNRVDLAYHLNAEVIVLHLDLPWQRFENEKGFEEKFYRQALKSFDELESYCKTRNIRICIENESPAPQAHSRRMFEILFERYDKDYMGICFDTGHANIACRENNLDFAERFNDRIFICHIHDNRKDSDIHLLPFEGNFDWEGFAKILARSPCKFPIVMESIMWETGDDKPWLENAFESGSRFTAMVQKYRQE